MCRISLRRHFSDKWISSPENIAHPSYFPSFTQQPRPSLSRSSQPQRKSEPIEKWRRSQGHSWNIRWHIHLVIRGKDDIHKPLWIFLRTLEYLDFPPRNPFTVTTLSADWFPPPPIGVFFLRLLLFPLPLRFHIQYIFRLATPRCRNSFAFRERLPGGPTLGSLGIFIFRPLLVAKITTELIIL